MAKYMLLYNGPATPPEKMDPTQVQKIMGAWQRWMESVGPAMLEMGSPLGNGRALVDDGTETQATLMNGYSIIEAKDMDAAVKLTEGHPFLSDHTGKFKVEVFEVLPTPGM